VAIVNLAELYSRLHEACAGVASLTPVQRMRSGATVIVHSAFCPGTTQEQVLRWHEDGSALTVFARFHLG
jgi:UDP-N-acetyl-D-mannosaminuronate dehydrogenase